MAYLDTNACVVIDGHTYPATVRSSECLLLSMNERCVACTSYRKTLFALHYKAPQATTDKSKDASRTNFRQESCKAFTDEYMCVDNVVHVCICTMYK